MLKILIEKEFREIIGSRKFVYSFAVCSFLIILTFFVGVKNYEVNNRKYEASKSENIRSMKGVTDWRMVEHKIFLPPTPLSSIVSGISNDIGRTIDMQGRGELTAFDSRYNESPIFAVFRFLDLNFLFQVILSLFAILFAYNAINGEREQGTLKLIFSNSVPKDKYIIAKIVGTAGVLFVAILIPFLIGIAILLFSGIALSAEEWMKLLLIIVSGFLFTLAFLTLSVFVSTITKKSSGSFLILLVVWIFAVLVIPRTSVLVAGRMIDVPSIDKINSQKSAFNRQVSEELMKNLTNLKVKDGEDAIQALNRVMEENGKEREKQLKSFYQKVNEQRRNKQIEQEQLAFTIARLSPASCFNFAVSELAGTSLNLIRDFENSAKTYQKIYENFQIEKTGMATGSGMQVIVRSNDEEAEEINPSEMPQFKFRPAGFSEVFTRAASDLGILALFNLIFFMAAYIKFLKYDVR
ncbi:MAG: ABC transporter permease subunit [Rhodothermaceae bacterium]